jgi:hypothetical protein
LDANLSFTGCQVLNEFVADCKGMFAYLIKKSDLDIDMTLLLAAGENRIWWSQVRAETQNITTDQVEYFCRRVVLIIVEACYPGEKIACCHVLRDSLDFNICKMYSSEILATEFQNFTKIQRVILIRIVTHEFKKWLMQKITSKPAAAIDFNEEVLRNEVYNYCGAGIHAVYQKASRRRVRNCSLYDEVCEIMSNIRVKSSRNIQKCVDQNISTTACQEAEKNSCDDIISDESLSCVVHSSSHEDRNSTDTDAENELECILGDESLVPMNFL